MFSGKFFRGIKEKMFGTPKRSSTFDSERSTLVDFDRFVSTVLTTAQDFSLSMHKLATLHDSLFQLCDVLYPVGVPARNHIVSIKDLLEIFSQRHQRAEGVLVHVRDVAGGAAAKNQVIFGALDQLDKLANLLDHYDDKLRKLKDQLQDAQRSNEQRRVEALTTKIIRNEGKRNGHKVNLDNITRDVNFDIHEIIENRMRISNMLIAELAELYATAFDDLQGVLDLLREQSGLLKLKAGSEGNLGGSPSRLGTMGVSPTGQFVGAGRPGDVLGGAGAGGAAAFAVGAGVQQARGPQQAGGGAQTNNPAVASTPPPTAYSNLNPPPGTAASQQAPPPPAPPRTAQAPTAYSNLNPPGGPARASGAQPSSGGGGGSANSYQANTGIFSGLGSLVSGGGPGQPVPGSGASSSSSGGQVTRDASMIPPAVGSNAYNPAILGESYGGGYNPPAVVRESFNPAVREVVQTGGGGGGSMYNSPVVTSSQQLSPALDKGRASPGNFTGHVEGDGASKKKKKKREEDWGGF